MYDKIIFFYSPSPGMMRSVTVLPASLMRLTMSEWDLLVILCWFTARMRSPTFSFPQRSAGLPSMIRPILWGMATHALPAMVTIHVWYMIQCVCRACCCLVQEREREKRKGRKRGKGSREEEKKIQGYIVESTASESQSHRDKL